MTIQTDAARTLGLAALTLACLAPLACEKKQPGASLGGRSSSTSAPSTEPAAPPPPPAPVALSPADLDLAPGAQFPAQFIPVDESAARAIAALASAIALGDADALAGMIDRADAAVLEHLRETGQWDDATAGVTVRVVAVEPADPGVRVGLAIQDDAGAYLIGWEGAPARGVWTFRSLPVESPAAARAADLDGAALALMDIPAPGPEIQDAAPTRPPVEENPRGRRRRTGTGLGG